MITDKQIIQVVKPFIFTIFTYDQRMKSCEFIKVNEGSLVLLLSKFGK